MIYIGCLCIKVELKKFSLLFARRMAKKQCREHFRVTISTAEPFSMTD